MTLRRQRARGRSPIFDIQGGGAPEEKLAAISNPEVGEQGLKSNTDQFSITAQQNDQDAPHRRDRSLETDKCPGEQLIGLRTKT